ncbi:MAG TPA: peptidoglycan-binding domain-containing protein [Burkholderiaceae bacterium]
MSRLLKSLSSLVRGDMGRSSKRAAGEPDGGPSTLTTPLFPVDGSDSELPDMPQRPAQRHAEAGAQDVAPSDAAKAIPLGTLVPLTPQPAVHKPGRKPASSRALNAVVRANTQVALPSYIEPTPPPKVTRAGHRSGVVLTETEKLRLQIMQVQIKLTGLGLYDGAIDGMMSPNLANGVRHFQTLKGMRDSGLLTTGVFTALGIRSID